MRRLRYEIPQQTGIQGTADLPETQIRSNGAIHLLRNTILLLAMWLASFCSQPADATTNDNELIVGVGSSQSVPASSSARITVSNGRTVRAEDLGARVRITGRKPGVSAVSIGGTTYLVRVLDATSFHLFERVKAETLRMQGLESDVEDGRVVVRGRLLRLQDWTRLAEIAGTGARFLFAADPDPLIRDEVNVFIANRLRQASLPVPDLQLAPALVRLSAERADLASRFEQVLGPFGFAVEKNSGALTLEPLVRVRILVTEIRRKFMRRLGVEWPGSYQAQLLPGWNGLTATGQANGLSVQLNALEENGEGRILASPNLLCRSGKEAQFLAGGEFPIKLTARKSSEVIWKRYGVSLKIKPKADFSGRMSIALETEVSTIDTSQTVEGVPGLLTNRIESHFDLQGTRTIALSGLIRQESGQSAGGLPGLTSLPILGSLFSSREFRDEKTELVVFVTPEVLREGDAP